MINKYIDFSKYVGKDLFIKNRSRTVVKLLLFYSVIHISTHPSKELCCKMALGEVGVSLP